MTKTYDTLEFMGETVEISGYLETLMARVFGETMISDDDLTLVTIKQWRGINYIVEVR